ncbi:MAG: peptidylprolyl isomerase [Dysgonamonadaceae bacterium]|jgi:peptidyl-prolyl cis-trans isomerase SurA|nr:peptidylprolyl isomerase [Dysgonamonadaceae bacterium]
MKRNIFFVVLLFCAVSLAAQSDDPVIMTINGKEIRKSEFEYSYSKNNNDDVIEKKTLPEYVELFENLKFKVMEAEAEGMDTTEAFRSEFNDYRLQLARQYLNEPVTDEALLRKEYDRMSEIVEISHLFIAYPESLNLHILPADTLAAYKKAVQLNNRIAKGEDFEKLVREFSDDKEVAEAARPGYLGWYKALQLVPALEDLAYAVPVGKTGIGRSNFGYHIIKVHARRSIPGQIRIAHIVVKQAENDSTGEAEKKINDIYARLAAGEDFAELAKNFSDDKENASKGGELGWISFGDIIADFQNQVFALKNPGDYTKPFKTAIGWHIAKLLETKPLDSFESKRDEIEKRLISGGFSLQLQKQKIDDWKAENHFEKNEAAYRNLMTTANTIYPGDSAFYSLYENSPETLFTVEGQAYPISDFIVLFKKNPRSTYSLSVDNLDEHIRQFEFNSLYETEDRMLESRYPEFRDLVREYRDAILMFNISSQEVWDKAAADTEGLERFFAANRSNYAWSEPHFKGYAVEVKDAKTKKQIQKEIKKMTPEAAVEYMNENYRVGDVNHVRITQGLFKQGDNKIVDELAFKGAKATADSEFQDYFILGKVLDAPESYSDVRGLVVADYQDYLEQEWLKTLRSKYKVEINEKVLNTLK